MRKCYRTFLCLLLLLCPHLNRFGLTLDITRDTIRQCQQDGTIAITSCNGKGAYTALCREARDNLRALGVGHLIITHEQHVCDRLEQWDCCATTSWLANWSDLSTAAYLIRWLGVRKALNMGVDVILQDCDVVWTSNPTATLRAQAPVIQGLREVGTAFPFNAGLLFFKSSSSAARTVVKTIVQRAKTFLRAQSTGNTAILAKHGIASECANSSNIDRMVFDQGLLNDAIESVALNITAYTRSTILCDNDRRPIHFEETWTGPGESNSCTELEQVDELACLAPCNIFASWLWNCPGQTTSGDKVSWNVSTPLALGYHFVGVPLENKLRLMQQVLRT
ncbi:hypothetical protein CYMTET_55088 [Cymbomonas tetramitiformis]|uniref:Nucleotide-diphospho-sugar transferase domain-containing protein n=1 Tax=Cymbomonas tetramitiformis TaxID=36881 RepID=A0AAE0BF87_9CHLO|nr:hypothetical protein CYMTET_55088 [Cymbomonas tetramitiformis]|eukprot:gene333-605_t